MSAKENKGQSLVLVAFGIMTLIAFVGLAVDLGLSYMERIRARRAADAAALAAAAELPLEGAAHIRALSFLDENDYGCELQVNPGATSYYCGETTTVRLEIDGNYISGPTAEAAERTIRIATAEYRDNVYIADSSSRIRVEVEQKAPVYFMRLFGFGDIPVNGSATAENINNLDIVLVYDRSGSMEFDTLCYGCWTPSGSDYPSGNLNPLPWDSNLNGTADHCEGTLDYVTYGSRRYIVIEAEEYSFLRVSYQREQYEYGKTYWVLQRNGGDRADQLGVPGYMRKGNGAGSLGRDDLGGYIQHAPRRTSTDADGLGVPCTWGRLVANETCRDTPWGTHPAPRVDYEFTVPTSGTYYFWFRGQGGDSNSSNPRNNYLFWGLSGGSYGSAPQPIGRGETTHRTDYTNGAHRNSWSWRGAGCGDSANLPCGQHLQAGVTYNLHWWAGGVGVSLDRMIITSDNRDPDTFFSTNDRSPHSSYRPLVDNVLNAPATSVSNDHRTNYACHPCDARFGGSPAPADPRRPVCTADMYPQPYRLLDDLYDDEQPMRGSVEAAKRFVRRLDPRYDQIGYVSYNNRATIESRLECLVRRGADTCAAGYDPDSGYSSNVVENTVISKLESTNASGGTNIGDGVRRGIDVLSNRVVDGTQHYGRPGAAHIMVVMTDGQTNTLDNLPSACSSELSLWPPSVGASYGSTVHRSQVCTVYYAMQARNNGIVIYSITLGAGPDVDLMRHIAELTGGIHRHAETPDQLDDIFDELYRRIFLRLVE